MSQRGSRAPAAIERRFFPVDEATVRAALGKERLLAILQQMLLIRQFETRAEAAYQQGKIGGFFHSYIGQEAIQTALLAATGAKHWFITTYRCHALALLLGESPQSIMAELFGRATGNAKGRGGSMHLYSDRMLGGFGIVGGQIPIATGAAFRCAYLGIKDEIAICFLGDGAIPTGSFHESLNMAALWNLPCMYVVENNQWSMGTHISRGVANHLQFCQLAAKAYGISSYTLDGLDVINCYGGFKAAYEEILASGRPVLIECVGERFKGHSISDPASYRKKEELKGIMQRDPILRFREYLLTHHLLSEEQYTVIDKAQREVVMEAIRVADASPWPDPSILEEGVFAR
jgi:pyruvate dehydrogenase E1 component alpha subunit